MKSGKITRVIGCGVQGCCPTLELKGEEVTVKDDFGNVVKMKKDQWIALAKKTLGKI